MTRTQVQQVIVIVLLLVFGGVWLTTRKSAVLRPAAPVVTTPAPRSPALPNKQEAQQITGQAAEEAASLARDLFHLPDRLLQKIRQREQTLEQPPAQQNEPAVEQTPAAPPAELSAWELQGVFWGTDKPQAIINRKILSVGDTIEGAKVTAITKEGVTLSQGGQELELKPKTEMRGSDSHEQ